MIKMNGVVSKYINEVTGNTYYSCVVKDATACCSQGVEFELEGYDINDYPPDGSEISIIGEFGTYEEDGQIYCRLNEAGLV